MLKYVNIPHQIYQEIFSFTDCARDVEGKFFNCLDRIPIFKWNNETQRCEFTTYGGCNPTNNNFETLSECQRVAESVCKNIR